MILGFVVSTIAFFVACYFIKRKLVEMDIPEGMTRSIMIFALAAAVASGVGWVVDLVIG